MEEPVRRAPQADALGFDHRLMTAERLYELAGSFPLRLSGAAIPLLWLDCAECGKGIEALTDVRGECFRVTAGQLLANVLRHRVMRHGLPLSGGGIERAGT